MNKTNYFIECLELMDWTVKPSGLCPGEWLVYKIDSHEHLTAQQIEDKARKELIKRDGVMERVVARINEEYPTRYYILQNDVIRILGRFGTDGPATLSFKSAIELAIELITTKELMGVEG